MRVLVLGGIRSGKSQWAETDIAAPAVRYVATGRTDSGDPEWSRRVQAHRSRRPVHWSTLETADVATALRTDNRTATLVDDIGGWLTATMDRRDAWNGGSVSADIDELCVAVRGFTGRLSLVSPEVGLTIVPATAGGRLFADELGTLNQRLAALCDRVVLVVAGQPLVVKESM
ncbi:bifunctional adenosylcobinamide kinase/adenosylcobinamide-phosphate guanylyltransferase [Mycobacterium sp. AMU20-3851]|uniref:bifunctional adenosylcobinamide kinase/adenosylcobinamide-phosphate guanylyltransferase n=1 Tax=Mycobacterium sp. AMU20-3851 TaxID=3122055 RepID=UPI0037547847